MRRLLCVILCAALLCVGAAAKEEAILRRGTAGEGKVALSFDDGPHAHYTEEILEILSEFGVKATFFIVGENAEKHPDIVRRTAKEGHEIANHTYTHLFLNRMSVAKMCLEVTETSDLLEALTGTRPRLFRPPGGSYSDRKVSVLRDMGYTCVLWSRDSRDWTMPSVSTAVSNALSGVQSGDILLFHDFNRDGSPTPEALRTLIPALREQGLEPVTVSEILDL